jgi:hypothetical protein
MLVKDGWSERDVRAFPGGNFLRAFRAIWIDGPTRSALTA